MGLFTVKVRIANMATPEKLGEPIEVLVDTGATYTTLPQDVLKRHHIRRLGKIKVKLANGKWVTKDQGGAILRVDGRLVATQVLFGKPKDIPVLGAITLEGACLAVDPVGKRLVPTIAIQA